MYHDGIQNFCLMFTSQNQHPHLVPSQETKPAPVTLTPATPVPQQDQGTAPDAGFRSDLQGVVPRTDRQSVAEDREVVLDGRGIQIPQVVKEPKKINLSHSDRHGMWYTHAVVRIKTYGFKQEYATILVRD
jgi:hypothetical protein